MKLSKIIITRKLYNKAKQVSYLQQNQAVFNQYTG